MKTATVRAYTALGESPSFDNAVAYWQSYGYLFDCLGSDAPGEQDGDHTATMRGLETLYVSIWCEEDRQWHVFSKPGDAA
jgi:hypothetical protein